MAIPTLNDVINDYMYITVEELKTSEFWSEDFNNQPQTYSDAWITKAINLSSVKINDWTGGYIGYADNLSNLTDIQVKAVKWATAIYSLHWLSKGTEYILQATTFSQGSQSYSIQQPVDLQFVPDEVQKILINAGLYFNMTFFNLTPESLPFWINNRFDYDLGANTVPMDWVQANYVKVGNTVSNDNSIFITYSLVYGTLIPIMNLQVNLQRILQELTISGEFATVDYVNQQDTNLQNQITTNATNITNLDTKFTTITNTQQDEINTKSPILSGGSAIDITNDNINVKYNTGTLMLDSNNELTVKDYTPAVYNYWEVVDTSDFIVGSVSYDINNFDKVNYIYKIFAKINNFLFSNPISYIETYPNFNSNITNGIVSGVNVNNDYLSDNITITPDGNVSIFNQNQSAVGLQFLYIQRIAKENYLLPSLSGLTINGQPTTNINDNPYSGIIWTGSETAKNGVIPWAFNPTNFSYVDADGIRTWDFSTNTQAKIDSINSITVGTTTQTGLTSIPFSPWAFKWMTVGSDSFIGLNTDPNFWIEQPDGTIIPDDFRNTSLNDYLPSSGGIASLFMKWLYDNKQDNLVSGTNIKTINSQSILGSGNLVITGNPRTLISASVLPNIATFPTSQWNPATEDLFIAINSVNVASGTTSNRRVNTHILADNAANYDLTTGTPYNDTVSTGENTGGTNTQGAVNTIRLVQNGTNFEIQVFQRINNNTTAPINFSGIKIWKQLVQ